MKCSGYLCTVFSANLLYSFVPDVGSVQTRYQTPAPIWITAFPNNVLSGTQYWVDNEKGIIVLLIPKQEL
jgi:hypothetical protein